MLRKLTRNYFGVVLMSGILLTLLFSIGCKRQLKFQNTPEPVKRKEFKINTQIPSEVEHIKDIEYSRIGDKSLRLNILRPRELYKHPLPVIIWIHGGGWSSGSKDDYTESMSGFAEQGYLVASIEYRLSFEAKFPAQLEDAKAAVRFLRANALKFNINPEKIGVWGASAGGHLAALLGTTGDTGDFDGSGGWQEQSGKVKAACTWFGPTDFTSDGRYVNFPIGMVTDLIGASPLENKELAARASVTTYVSSGDVPFLIMHGDKDQVVPLDQSEILYEKLKSAGIKADFRVIKGADHGFTRIEEFRTVLDFFDRELAI